MSIFREKLLELSREDLYEIIKEQDPELYAGCQRIEWVFANKLRHLNWADGSQITERPITKEELALLIDEPFEPDPELIGMGIGIDDQYKMHIAADPVLWARHYLGVTPRVYQILILRDPAARKVLRAGRRLGKSFSMAILLLHYAFTHNDGRCIVVTPMKSQAEVIYQEVLRMAKGGDGIVSEAIIRKVTSPQFMIQFSNGSTVRFFTSGMKSGGKADVVRGQEAHMIVLDELDYMHDNDLEALYAMLQKTDDNQDEKILVGASTPTGRRSTFWRWCTQLPSFKEFWFPSFVNPFFSKETEDEFRSQYTEMGFRHEVEADWGEDTDGVYPRKYVDLAFNSGRLLMTEEELQDSELLIAKSDWKYVKGLTSARSFFIIGVDWDKYGAGSNIVVIEICDDEYEDSRAAGRIRIAYREEVPRDEYTLTNAVQRIIELNQIFRPRYIYVDRGNGEVQVELLHKHGKENPSSGLDKVVKGVQFSETVEVRDPATKELVKKHIKPFMVDNLRQMFEREEIVIPSSDEELYIQLLSYVVVRISESGRPVFSTSIETVGDHAHDALMLACYGYLKHFGELMNQRRAVHSRAISNSPMLPMMDMGEVDPAKEIRGIHGDQISPSKRQRLMTVKMDGNRRPGSPMKRKMF